MSFEIEKYTHMTSNFSQMLAHVTGGRRYCFVIMTYHEGYAFFERIRSVVAEQTGVECIRADDIPPGEDLRAKIHSAMESAAFVIADVSHPRPNIFYEVGYAAARNKPMLFLAREDVAIPTDLLGVELIRYRDNKEGWASFDQSLRKYLAIHAESNVSLLRAMIVPKLPHPAYIVLNPKQPKADSRFQFHPHERRTYGDYLGVTGILGAFASVYGEHFLPEVLSAKHAPPDLVDWDANLFLIGSHKSNDFTRLMLNNVQQGRLPNWQFGKCPGEEEKGDYEVQLSGDLSSGRFTTPSLRAQPKGGGPHTDYGLVVRGPHPRYPQRMVCILAGPHSLGTGAACLAATKSQVIRQTGKRLSGACDLATRDQTIWILVKGTAADDRHIDPTGVEVLDVGVYR